MDSFMARLKALAGHLDKDKRSRRAFRCLPRFPSAIASATNIVIPSEGVVFEISGSTGVANIRVQGGEIVPGREIVLTGATGANAALTDTALGSTAAGTVHTTGAFSIAPSATIRLWQQDNGSWYEIGRTAALG
jgi:hypothetical protein